MRVMPLTSLVADVFGAVTLSFILLFIAAGLCCIAHVLYFRYQIRRERISNQLQYFNVPWIIRISLIVYAILWSLGEIFRLPLLRTRGWLLYSLSPQWQRNVCRLYLLSNLGMMEPGFFLTLIFLVHGSLHRTINSWNRRTVSFVVALCLPVFLAQLFLVVISPSFEFQKGYRKEKEGYGARMPKYFTRSSWRQDDMIFCAYPLFSTIVNGVYACLFITYFLYVGMRMISFVINKGLKRRVYWLIFTVCGLLPLRILFLGFSVLSIPGRLAFEAPVFLGFIALLFCAAVGIWVLVYLPVSDSLVLNGISGLRQTRNHQYSNMIPLESFSRTLSGFVSDNDENSSFVASQSLLEGAVTSIGRDSDSSTKGSSISFRTLLKDVSSGPLEEVTLFAEANRMLDSPAESPPLPGQPMLSFH